MARSTGRRKHWAWGGLGIGLVLGCISDENRPQPVAEVDTASDADVEAAACTVEGARECVSSRVARSCVSGRWQAQDCKSGESCTRSTGTCTKGTYSCLGTLVCNVDCARDDEGCIKKCQAETTVPAVDALGILNACQCAVDCWPLLCGRLLPWPSFSEISSCVQAQCAQQAASCVGGGETGDGGCVAIRDCTLACAGDVFCAEGCFATGTAEAQTTAAFYYMCVRKECGPDPEPACLFSAQANRCADLWAECRGEP